MYTKPRRRKRLRGSFFYLPYTFAGSRQNKLYFNTLVLLILDCLFACHRLLRVLSHTVNILELFDYKLLYREGVAAATPNYSYSYFTIAFTASSPSTATTTTP